MCSAIGAAQDELRRLLPLNALFSADEEVALEHPVEIDNSKVESDMACKGLYRL